PGHAGRRRRHGLLSQTAPDAGGGRARTGPPSGVAVVKERLAAADPDGMGTEAGSDDPGRGGPDERLAELIAAAQADPESTAIVTLLGLGSPAVAALVATLAAEAAPGRRARLVGLLEELAPAHLDLVESALGGAPWYLARNLATVLGRVGQVEHLPVLEE